MNYEHWKQHTGGTPEQYEEYKEQRAKNGIPVRTDKEFMEEFLKAAATKLNPNLKKPPKEIIPKRTWRPSPEQEVKLSAYYKKVCAADKQKDLKTSYRFDTNLMDVKDAKLKVWDIMKQEANEREVKLSFDNYNKHLLDQLTKYFIRSDEFEGSLNKGIALVGDVGRGKSFLMEVFQIFTVAYELPTAFSIVDMKHIAREANEKGATIIPNYTQLIKSYDDVGFEEKVRHYGNQICVFTDLINIAYTKFTKTGKTCHMTSNLTNMEGMEYDTFEDRYGKRVNSRLKEMFNFLYLGGQDKRK